MHKIIKIDARGEPVRLLEHSANLICSILHVYSIRFVRYTGNKETEAKIPI